MEQVKHNAVTENSVKRYVSPEVKAVFIKSQGVFCGSLGGTPSNSPWTPGSDSTYGFGDDE